MRRTRAEALAAIAFAVLAAGGARAGESCLECHLHHSIAQEAQAGEGAARTLAGFHGRISGRDGAGPACRDCHGEAQNAGRLPGAADCIACHTQGRTAQGDPRRVFHAAAAHWLTGARVSCVDCHKGHVAGNGAVKFLAADAVAICAGCHERSFKAGVGGAPPDDAQD